MTDKINILWTGGWDSTYRVLRLSPKPVVIQPYYLKDDRDSEDIEINAIKTITKAVEKRPNTKCTILEPILKKVINVQKDDKITTAYNRLSQKDDIGSQYDWLARFAKNISNLELCVEQQDDFTVIRNNGGLVKKEENLKGSYHIIDEKSSTDDLLMVYGGFHFPIINTRKLEMKEWAKKNGFMDIMNKTWFCHHPINGEPCGICHPCIITIDQGLTYRLSKKALQRYKFNKMIPSAIKESRYYKKAKSVYRTIKK